MFNGIKYGNITPTDIDMAIEYKDKARILVEVKHGEKEVPAGQKLLLKRFVDDFRACGKDAIAIIAQHDVDDAEKDVQVASCQVREIYYKRKADGTDCEWRKPNGFFTVEKLIDAFIELNE